MQNKYFLDTNIIINLLVNSKYKNIRQNQQDEVSKTKEFIRNLIIDDNNICVIGSNSLTTTFFALTNKNKNLMSKTAELILDLYDNNEAFLIINESNESHIEALKYSQANNVDYEDMLQYFCAKENNCQFIITNDKNFPKLDLPLIDSYGNKFYTPSINNENLENHQQNIEQTNNLSEIYQEIQKMLNIPSVDEVADDKNENNKR